MGQTYGGGSLRTPHTRGRTGRPLRCKAEHSGMVEGSRCLVAIVCIPGPPERIRHNVVDVMSDSTCATSCGCPEWSRRSGGWRHGGGRDSRRRRRLTDAVSDAAELATHFDVTSQRKKWGPGSRPRRLSHRRAPARCPTG